MERDIEKGGVRGTVQRRKDHGSTPMETTEVLIRFQFFSNLRERIREKESKKQGERETEREGEKESITREHDN